MKKIFAVVLAVFFLVSCSTNKPKENEVEVKFEEIKVLFPSGTPAVSAVPLLKNKANVEFVVGPDPLQAALVNPQSDYDVIVAPINLGVALDSKGKTNYQLSHIISWGSLFVVGSDKEIINLGVFGEQSVPGILTKYLLDQTNRQYELIWFPSGAEASVALLSGEVDAAVLPQPAAAGVIAKAKKQNIEFKIIEDLQATYKEVTGFDNYPQAALFVKKGHEAQGGLVISAIESYLKDVSNLKADLDGLNIEEMGLTSSELIVKVYDQLNIDFVKVDSQVTEQINSFLKLFNLSIK